MRHVCCKWSQCVSTLWVNVSMYNAGSLCWDIGRSSACCTLHAPACIHTCLVFNRCSVIRHSVHKHSQPRTSTAHQTALAAFAHDLTLLTCPYAAAAAASCLAVVVAPWTPVLHPGERLHQPIGCLVFTVSFYIHHSSNVCLSHHLASA
jgi:hypothetical protein